jgi:hypothetical protein
MASEEGFVTVYVIGTPPEAALKVPLLGLMVELLVNSPVCVKL